MAQSSIVVTLPRANNYPVGDTENLRRKLVNDLTTSLGCAPAEAELLLLWIERMIVCIRMSNYVALVLTRTERATEEYRLFLRLFAPQTEIQPHTLAAHIQEYFLDPDQGEARLVHMRLSAKGFSTRVVFGILRDPEVWPRDPQGVLELIK